MTNHVHLAIDDTDKKILSYLSEDTRMPSYKIDGKLGISTDSVIRRIKKMEGCIIRKFTINLDFDRIGYHRYIMVLGADILSKSNCDYIRQYFATKNNVILAAGVFGSFDYIVELVSQDTDELSQIISDLKKGLSGVIKNYEIWLSGKEVMFRPFPKVLQQSG